MPSDVLEWPITRDYWEREMRSRGTLYRELEIVPHGRGQRRRADAVVVLDEADGKVIEKSVMQDLDGKRVVVIQTKATFLNAYVFGQALLSPTLICQKWSPASMKTIILCTSDLADLSNLIRREFPHIEICVREGQSGEAFYLDRISGAAAEYARAQSSVLIKCSVLPKGLPLDGILVDNLDRRPSGKRMLDPALVKYKDVTIIHTADERRARRPSNIGMWTAGEVIISQLILKEMGAERVQSIILKSGRDAPIEAALGNYASIRILAPDVLEVRINEKDFRYRPCS